MSQTKMVDLSICVAWESVGCESDVIVKLLNMQWVKSRALKAGFRFESWSRVCSQSGIGTW